MPIGASTVATSSLENYWDWSEGQAWFQLYVSGDGSLAKSCASARGQSVTELWFLLWMFLFLAAA